MRTKYRSIEMPPITEEVWETLLATTENTSLLAKLLYARGIQTPEDCFDFFSDGVFTDPFLFEQMAAAVSLVKAHATQKDSIVVFGDFDCDGISATAILVTHLQQIGASVSPYIPSRTNEGYGLNLNAIQRIAEEGCKLLITADCGISSIEEIRLAKELGMKVLLTDHHTPPVMLPPADIVLNPKLQAPESCKNLCGCGMVFKLICALGGNVSDYLPITAMATVGDIVPLTQENRTIVKWGLSQINQNTPQFLSILLEEVRFSGRSIGSGELAFLVVPRINAAGRMNDAMVAYRFLTEPQETQCREHAKALCWYNTQRQQIEEEILQAALLQIEDTPLLDSRGLYVFGEDWHQGVVGIVASRLSEQFQMPSVVGSIGKDGVVTASLRTSGNVDIHQALISVSDLLLRYGGHKQAGGCSLNRENIQAFIDGFEAYLLSEYDPVDFISYQEYDEKIEIKDVTLEIAKSLSLLEPYGCGNPMPIFYLEQVLPVEIQQFGKTAIHLKMKLTQRGKLANGILYRASSPLALDIKKRYDMVGTIEIERFRSVENGIFTIKHYEEADQDIGDLFSQSPYRFVSAYLDALSCPDNSAPEWMEGSFDETLFLLSESPYGTLMVASTPTCAMDYLRCVEEAASLGEDVRELFRIAFFTLPKNQYHRNALLVCPHYPISGIHHYARILYLDGFIGGIPELRNEQELLLCGHAEYIQNFAENLLFPRQQFVELYRTLDRLKEIRYKDLDELVVRMAELSGEPLFASASGLYQFLQLGFFQVYSQEGKISIKKIPQKEKTNILDTVVYQKLGEIAGGEIWYGESLGR